MHMALDANVNRRKGAKPFTPDDFMLDFLGRKRAREGMSAEAMEAAFRVMAAPPTDGASPLVGPDGRPVDQGDS